MIAVLRNRSKALQTEEKWSAGNEARARYIGAGQRDTSVRSVVHCVCFCSVCCVLPRLMQPSGGAFFHWWLLWSPQAGNPTDVARPP